MRPAKQSKSGSKKGAKPKPGAKKSDRAAKAVTNERADTKKAIVLEMLRRKEGATIGEIAKATDWQNHSIRGFLSAQVGKKLGLKVESEKVGGERRYRLG